jgi:8-oxo-dGTP pyrophosphatase MutT (NUDIX family)
MTLQWPFTKPRSVCSLIVRDGKVCRVTRRNKPQDFALVGGSIDPKDASAWDAMTRETFEEVGIEVVVARMVFERVDETDGGLAWCYLVTKWEGEPHQCEPGIGVSWGEPETLLAPNCTFREYNRLLFTHLGMIK